MKYLKQKFWNTAKISWYFKGKYVYPSVPASVKPKVVHVERLLPRIRIYFEPQSDLIR